MTGVSNTIKEFSDCYENLYNANKYIVEQNDEGIIIKQMEKVNNYWKEIASINIDFNCAEKLFSEIAESIRQGEFKREL